jgi:hypothetical protein
MIMSQYIKRRWNDVSRKVKKNAAVLDVAPSRRQILHRKMEVPEGIDSSSSNPDVITSTPNNERPHAIIFSLRDLISIFPGVVRFKEQLIRIFQTRNWRKASPWERPSISSDNTVHKLLPSRWGMSHLHYHFRPPFASLFAGCLCVALKTYPPPPPHKGLCRTHMPILLLLKIITTLCENMNILAKY